MANTIIGIAGGTGSGKTTVAESVHKYLIDKPVVLIHQDSYYKDLSHLISRERDKVNFDHPDAVDNDLLVNQINDLKEGRVIEKPVYDFKMHKRRKETVRVEPKEVILLEGILVLTNPLLRDLMDMKLYVDTDPDIRFIRRLNRDVKERGRSVESVIEQYISTVRPMHIEFVEPTKRYADVIIPNGGHNNAAIGMIVSRIRSLISERVK